MKTVKTGIDQDSSKFLISMLEKKRRKLLKSLKRLKTFPKFGIAEHGPDSAWTTIGRNYLADPPWLA